MILSIKSESRDSKYIYINEEKIKVEGDIFEFIKHTLKAKKIDISTITKFKAKASNSFTGYREAVVIANTLNHIILNVPLKNLQHPKYHKKPNINIK